MIWTYYINK